MVVEPSRHRVIHPGLDPRTDEDAALKLNERLAAMDLPDERSSLVRSADDLLDAIVYGSDARGRYFASPGLLRSLFYWDRHASASEVSEWLGELVARGDVAVAPLAMSCYSGRPVDVVTVLRPERFARFAKRLTIPHATRLTVYERDGFRCVTCGTDDELSLDHIYPHSLGGSDEIENLQTMCRSCNSRKGARV